MQNQGLNGILRVRFKGAIYFWTPRQVFKVFGDSSIDIFLDWCKNEFTQYNKKSKLWVKICKYNPKRCIEWISSKEYIDANLLALIISALDPFSEDIHKHGIEPWVLIFKQLEWSSLKPHSKLKLAHFFLPLILKNNTTVDNQFVEFSSYQVHNELAKERFDYGYWIKLKPLLPPLSWYNSWDKCKQLRNAIKKKGYAIKWDT